MRSRISLFVFSLIVLAPSGAYADSAVQTDWSGGDGILGPVLDWGNEFYSSSCIDWSYTPGFLRLLIDGILEHTVDGDFDGAHSIYSEDIDGDGDMDILGAAYLDTDIIWWENIDGSGTSWTEHNIDGNFNGARSVYSEDINGDSDMDILGAGGSFITWWENMDGSGTSWTEHNIDGNFNGARSVYSEDINGDGNMDVLCAGYYDNDIRWWENMDGSGTSWTEHTVDVDFFAATSVYSEDINGDGNMDVLGAAFWDDDITWWENVDGSGTSWVEHTINGDFNGATSVYSEDIDGDGIMDVLGTAAVSAEITWWENIDSSGTSWTEHTIDENFYGARSLYSEDMDDDGDMDVLGTAQDDDRITWWENVDGSGTSWTEHTVDGDFDGAISVYSEDMDGDGDMDVLGAAYYDDDITWWKLDAYYPIGTLESSIFEIAWPIDYSIEWGAISWLGTEPSNTELSFLVRASDDPGNMGSWSDTITVSGTSLAGLLGEYDGYLQYMAILETGNPDTTSILDEITIDWTMVGIEGTAEPIPSGTMLLPIAPNPSAGSPIIRFGLPETASVELSVFDLSGRLVSEIHGEEYFPGYHDVLVEDLSPGIYFCRMISGDFRATQQFVVIE